MSFQYAKKYFFSSPLFQFQNNVLANKLKKKIPLDSPAAISSGVAVSIKHNLSESSFNFLNESDEVFLEARNFIAGCMKSVLNDLKNENCGYKISFFESWYHISKKNSVHDYHSHSNCSWCGIWYLNSGSLDSGGKTIFYNPIKSGYIDTGSIHQDEKIISVPAEDGKLILFPSYLNHSQSIYTGKKDRIVIAFNLRILEKI